MTSSTYGFSLNFIYDSAGFLVFIVNVIFAVRAYTYLSRRKAIYKTNTLMGEVAEGSILNDVINVLKASKLIIVANIIYRMISLAENYRSFATLLTYASIIFSLYVIWNEYKSN